MRDASVRERRFFRLPLVRLLSLRVGDAANQLTNPVVLLLRLANVLQGRLTRLDTSSVDLAFAISTSVVFVDFLLGVLLLEARKLCALGVVAHDYFSFLPPAPTPFG